MINTFYVAFDENDDDVTPVISRAMGLLADRGLALPAASVAEDVKVVEIDYLADIHTIIRGEVRMRTQMVLRRLAELNPAEYGEWTFQDLAETLAAHGLVARKYNGTMVVRSADVARAVAERDNDQVNDDG